MCNARLQSGSDGGARGTCQGAAFDIEWNAGDTGACKERLMRSR
ncbi:hypothetical protein OROMI_017932 [Orobanche minor]